MIVAQYINSYKLSQYLKIMLIENYFPADRAFELSPLRVGYIKSVLQDLKYKITVTDSSGCTVTGDDRFDFGVFPNVRGKLVDILQKRGYAFRD